MASTYPSSNDLGAISITEDNMISSPTEEADIYEVTISATTQDSAMVMMKNELESDSLWSFQDQSTNNLLIYKKEVDSSGTITASEVEWDFVTIVSGEGEWSYYFVGPIVDDATFKIVYQASSWLMAGALTLVSMAVTVSF